MFPEVVPSSTRELRVAIVGTGPAASYAAEELLHRTEAEITMLDRSPVPGGLVRGGVAPDHQSTKRVGETFATLWHNPRLTLLTYVDVGRDVSHAELLEHHHAVVYASGAAGGRRLEVPGEGLPGSLSATDLVRWYNAEGGPDPDLRVDRAVVVGTGNVALDVARLLTADPAGLDGTDIGDTALDALRAGTVREVVLLGRRGPEDAAYTASELVALAARDDVDLVVVDEPRTRAAIEGAAQGSRAALLRGLPLVDAEKLPEPSAAKRVVLRFHAAVSEIRGTDRVEQVVLRGPDCAVLAAGLVVSAVGYRGRPVPDLPFDEATGTMPHEAGAVRDERGHVVPGTYVTGWVKRGPSGGIGANRACARETVATLLDDLGARPLPRLRGSARGFRRLVRRRQPAALGLAEVLRLDAHEREQGRALGRPRVKTAALEEQLRAAGVRRASGSRPS